jgi:hypothetical protein
MGISALLKIGIFELCYFFYNVVPGASNEWWAILCIITIDFLDTGPID